MTDNESDGKIHRLIDDYIANYTETTNIRKDIQNYHKQFKNRLDQLKKDQTKIQTDIIKYLEDNNLPGIRRGEFIILAEEKQKQIKKTSREEQIKSLLNEYQIDYKSQLAQQITNIVTQTRSDEKIKYIKCKQCN